MNNAFANKAIRISPAQVPRAAKTVARRSGLIAIPTLLFGAVLMVLIVVHFSAVGTGKHSDPAPIMLALPFVSIGSLGVGIRALVTQRRATLAAVKANADPMTFWYLDGFVVIPYVRGVPDRTLSFTVPPKLRMHLANAGRYVPPP
jgi:hypothetical protein